MEVFPLFVLQLEVCHYADWSIEIKNSFIVNKKIKRSDNDGDSYNGSAQSSQKEGKKQESQEFICISACHNTNFVSTNEHKIYYKNNSYYI